MLPALVAGLLAATAPYQAEMSTPGSRPGVVVLVASPLRDRAATLPHSAERSRRERTSCSESARTGR
jgi:hypothetical protein